MAGVTEIQALTTSIGEFAVDTLGADNVEALQVIVNPREMCAFVTVSLSDSSDDSQRRAIGNLLEVEKVYADDLTIEFVFVDEIPEPDEEMASAPQYVYA
jgi:hypothetical protein